MVSICNPWVITCNLSTRGIALSSMYEFCRVMKDSMKIKLGLKKSLKFGKDTRTPENSSQYMRSIVLPILYWENMLVDMDK